MSVQDIIEEVTTSCCASGSPRQKQIIGSLIKHLHGFVADIKPNDDEWMSAIQFLTDVGQMCNDKRQEFILLSDVLGVTALKDHINNQKPEGATEATVLGPFYRDGVKRFAMGSCISEGDNDGERCLVRGRVTDIVGNPIEGALVDVWQAAANGLYEQQDEGQPDMNLRGCFETGPDGYYWFETVKPNFYPIPTDGPVGKLLKQLGRHEFRPGHIHFIVSSPDYTPVITQYFDKNCEFVESDTVYGVKKSLLIDFDPAPEQLTHRYMEFPKAKWTADCDFVLVPSENNQ